MSGAPGPQPRTCRRQACSREAGLPTARCAASCCPARRGQVDAGGLVQPQRGQLLRLRGPPFLAGQQLRPRVAPPHRPGREHVTPPQRPVQFSYPARTARRRGGRPSRRTRRGRRRPAAAMTRSSATRPPRPSSCTCRECFCLRVWEFSGFCGRPVRACTWIGRVRARACVHMVYSASGMSIIVHRLCRSGAMWSCRQERTVKPSAQPTLVRTQHLPHLRKRPACCGNAARRAVFFLSRHVSGCVTAGRCVAVVTDI